MKIIKVKRTIKIIGIIGSRRRDSQNDYILVKEKFLELYSDGDMICSGGCPQGGDRFAYLLHKSLCIPYIEFPANWDRYKKSAGMIRNTDIAKWSDVLIACVAHDRKGGTENTISKFIEFGKKDKLHLIF